MDKMSTVKTDTTRVARGKGDIGQELPMANDQNMEEAMDKSLQGTPMSALTSGYSGGGSIADSSKSNPMDMRPGANNKK